MNRDIFLCVCILCMVIGCTQYIYMGLMVTMILVASIAAVSMFFFKRAGFILAVCALLSAARFNGFVHEMNRFHFTQMCILQEGKTVSASAYVNRQISGAYVINRIQCIDKTNIYFLPDSCSIILKTENKLYPGQKIQIRGRMFLLQSKANPESFSFSQYADSERMYGYFYAQKCSITGENIRSSLFRHIDKNTSFNGGGIITGILTGTADKNSQMYESFRKLGLAHILCVSGLHMSAVSSLVFFILSRFSKKPALFCAVIAVFMYMWLSGFKSSAIRAGFCAVLFFLSEFFERDFHRWRIFTLVLLLSLAENPHILFNSGFQLSYGAAAAVMRISELTVSLKWHNRVMVMQLLLSVCMFPATVYLFGYFNPVSIVLNCVAVFIVPALFAGAFFHIVFSYFCIFSCVTGFFGIVCSAAVSASQIFQGFSCGILSAECSISLAVLFLCLFKKFPAALIFLLMLFLYEMFFLFSSEIIFFDTGDSEAIALRSGREMILIDTGDSYTRCVNEFIIKNRIYLKKIVITHNHADHYGGLSGIQSAHYNSILTTETVKNNRCIPDDKAVEICQLYQNIFTGNFNLLVCNTAGVVNSENENNRSLICYVLINGISFVLCADACLLQETYINRIFPGNAFCFKANHHGSKSSNTQKTIHHFSPQISVICAPEKSRFGNPDSSVMKRLSEYSAVYQTGIYGAVRIFPVGKYTFVLSSNISKNYFDFFQEVL